MGYAESSSSGESSACDIAKERNVYVVHSVFTLTIKSILQLLPPYIRPWMDARIEAPCQKQRTTEAFRGK